MYSVWQYPAACTLTSRSFAPIFGSGAVPSSYAALYCQCVKGRSAIAFQTHLNELDCFHCFRDVGRHGECQIYLAFLWTLVGLLTKFILMFVEHPRSLLWSLRRQAFTVETEHSVTQHDVAPVAHDGNGACLNERSYLH
jgi:hypothetical protein